MLALRQLLIKAPEHLKAHSTPGSGRTHSARVDGAITVPMQFSSGTGLLFCRSCWAAAAACSDASHLHDAQGGHGDGVAEVAAGWAHGAHDGDAALALGRAQARHPPRALVEAGQPRAQVRWVPCRPPGGRAQVPGRRLTSLARPAWALRGCSVPVRLSASAR